MSHRRINPATLFDPSPFGFSQVVTTSGRRLVHCAGQTAWDRAGRIIGEGDFAVQMTAALGNLGHALEAAGADRKDVASLKIYVVDHRPEKLPVIGDALIDFFGPDHLPANTLIGVVCLAVPDFLVEIEALAVLAGA